MTDANGVVGIKDFTTPQGNKPYPFKIDDDVFYAVSDIPLGRLAELAKLRANIDLSNIHELLSLFDEMLLDDSAALFQKRLNDKVNPIGKSHIIPVLEWLMETYGLRPTQPSSPSSTLSATDDSTNLTVGAQPVELTGAISGPVSS
jgi:hypothetical protein